MTQVGRFGVCAFVHCTEKGLCGPSVLPGPNQEGPFVAKHGANQAPGFALACCSLKDKEARPQRFWTEQKICGSFADQTCQNQSGEANSFRRRWMWKAKGRTERRGFTVRERTESVIVSPVKPVGLVSFGWRGRIAGNRMRQ